MTTACRACCAQLQFEMVCKRPPRSLRSRLPLTEGETYACNLRALFSPSVRGSREQSERGGRSHAILIPIEQPRPCRPRLGSNAASWLKPSCVKYVDTLTQEGSCELRYADINRKAWHSMQGRS